MSHARRPLHFVLCALVLLAVLIPPPYTTATATSDAATTTYNLSEEDSASVSPGVFAALTTTAAEAQSTASAKVPPSLQHSESDTTTQSPPPPVPVPSQASHAHTDDTTPRKRVQPLSSLRMAEAATLYEAAMAALYSENNLTHFVELVQAGAAAGHGRLHWLLGVLHAYGLGVAQDDKRAHFHYVQAARRGIAEAHTALSFRLRHSALYAAWRRGQLILNDDEDDDMMQEDTMYASGKKTHAPHQDKSDKKKYKDELVFSSIEDAALRDTRLSTEGMCGPAWLHHRAAARAVMRSYAGSLNTPWPQSIKDGFSDQMHSLISSAGGLSAQRRRRAAQRHHEDMARQIQIRLYRADNADREALHELYFLHLIGFTGLHRDWHESRRYGERLLALGDRRAYGMLGHLYLRGEAAMWPPVARDVATAAAYYARGAALGDAVSMHGLGYLHVHGYMKNNTLLPGLMRQFAPLTSSELRQLAADDTYSGRALMNISTTSLKDTAQGGRAVPGRYAVPDIEGGIAWYKRAASLGEMESLEHLAELLAGRNDPWSRSTVYSLLNLSIAHGQALSALRVLELFRNDSSKLSCAATMKVFDRVIASARWFDAESPSSDLLTADWYDYEEEREEEGERKGSVEDALEAELRAVQERQNAPHLPRYADNNDGEEVTSSDASSSANSDEVTAAMREPVALDRERLHELRRLGLLVRRRTRVLGDKVPTSLVNVAQPSFFPPPPVGTNTAERQTTSHTPTTTPSATPTPMSLTHQLQQQQEQQHEGEEMPPPLPAFVPDLPQATMPYQSTWRVIGNGIYRFIRSILPNGQSTPHEQVRVVSPPVVWLLENLALAEMGHKVAVWNCIDALDELIHVPGEELSARELIHHGLADPQHIAFAVTTNSNNDDVVPEWVQAASNAETIYLQWYHAAPEDTPHDASDVTDYASHTSINEQPQHTTSASASQAVRLLSQKEAKQMLMLRLLQHPQLRTSSEAALRLGDMYYYGSSALLGTDMRAAALAYEKAAAQNNSQALFNLGVMHQLGLAPLPHTASSNAQTADAHEARDVVLRAAAALPAHVRLWRRVRQILHHQQRPIGSDAEGITQEDLAQAFDYYTRAEAVDQEAHAAVYTALWTLNLQWWWMYFRGDLQEFTTTPSSSNGVVGEAQLPNASFVTEHTTKHSSESHVVKETTLPASDAKHVDTQVTRGSTESRLGRLRHAISAWPSRKVQQARDALTRLVHWFNFAVVEKVLLVTCLVVLFTTLTIRQHIM